MPAPIERPVLCAHCRYQRFCRNHGNYRKATCIHPIYKHRFVLPKKAS